MGTKRQASFRQPVKKYRVQNQKIPKKPYDRILIVCEDSKHSVAYFRAFIKDKRLSSSFVVVCGEECGSAPQKVFEYAKERLEEGDGDCFDRVYLVLDEDGHPRLNDTLKAVENHNMNKENKKPSTLITVIVSYPCFEYWILLHFEATTRSFSKCDDLRKAIKKHMLSYEKEGYGDLYNSHLKARTETAIKHSKYTQSKAVQERRENPSTKLYLLIEDLIKESEK